MNRVKSYLKGAIVLMVLLLFHSCASSKSVLGKGSSVFTCSLPCKTVFIHPEKKGKALMVLWLHGGVHARHLHDLRAFNHLDCCAADDSIVSYLERKGMKAVCIMPVCYKANLDKLITWKECADDVKAIIDDYINNGVVDKNRIFLTGSSDGGTGSWDFAEMMGDMFVAGIALSCGDERMVSIPMFWHSTRDEADYTERANLLKAKGCQLEYEYHSNYDHGKDEQICTSQFLDRFFALKKK